MLRRCLPILAALLLWALPAAAWQMRRSGVSADARLDYSSYSASEGGEDAGSGQHFLQQYSLLYTNEGFFNGGRGGQYRVNLGYEFNTLDTTINDVSSHVTTGKVLFRGNVLIAPGALPLRINVFSEDMNRSQFMKSTTLRRPSSDPNSYIGESIFDPGLYDDLANGSHVLSGATLIAGIRNGSYLGQYREMLSHLPRLVIDYKQLDVNDTKTLTPERWRQRDLAFISLNKKDNWFHLRLRDYEDFINGGSNFAERTITLGSIDSTLQRQWINLTNWIQLSADGNFNAYMPANSTLGPTETFYVNLHAVTRRERWKTTTFASYQRETNDFWLEKDLNVPFAIAGELSPDTSYTGRLELSKELSKETRPQAQMGSQTAFYAKEDDNYFAAMRLVTGRRQPRTLTWLADLERRVGTDGEGSALRVGAELMSNAKFRPRANYLLGYTATLIQGDGFFNEHVLTANYEISPNPRLRTGVREKFIFGNGEMDSQAVSKIPLYSQGSISTQRSAAGGDGTTLHSIFSWYGDVLGSNGLSDRVSVDYDWLESPSDSLSAVIFNNLLQLRRPTLTCQLETNVVAGDSEATSGGLALGTIQIQSTSGQGKLMMKNIANIDYSPGRQWELTGRLRHTMVEYKSGETDSRLDFKETWDYNIYTVNGVVRKLATFGNEFLYERYEQTAETWQTYSLTGKADWNPKANLTLGTQLRYRFYSPENVDQLTLITRFEANYQKLIFSLSYAIGERTAGKGYASRSENRLEVKVRKIF